MIRHLGTQSVGLTVTPRHGCYGVAVTCVPTFSQGVASADSDTALAYSGYQCDDVRTIVGWPVTDLLARLLHCCYC